MGGILGMDPHVAGATQNIKRDQYLVDSPIDPKLLNLDTDTATPDDVSLPQFQSRGVVNLKLPELDSEIDTANFASHRSTNNYNYNDNALTETSPFISTETYNKIMRGGAIDNVQDGGLRGSRTFHTPTESMSAGNEDLKYGFSSTSSGMLSTASISDKNNTPVRLDSSSLNTSDINLVSVDSREGRY